MLDRIPFRCACRQMRHCDRQMEFVCQLLQAKLPSIRTTTIRIATVGFNEQLPLLRIMMLSYLQPPTPNRSTSKLWGLMRCANYDEAFITSDIINSIGNRYALSIAGIIV